MNSTTLHKWRQKTMHCLAQNKNYLLKEIILIKYKDFKNVQLFEYTLNVHLLSEELNISAKNVFLVTLLNSI